MPIGGRPTITTSLGQYAGVTDGELEYFRGLAYAAPPVGELRWRPPMPAAPWQGVKDASQFGPICPQASPRTSLEQSEDCLTLNVCRPIGAARAPVLVWIHGGGNRRGASSDFAWDGDGAVFARQGIVFVSINYRLGNLGFFAHPALTAEAGAEPATNFGLLDQAAALRWVREHIAGFGGGPASVTVCGHSAGGGAVLNLLSRPQTSALFARAIVQSGGGVDPPETFQDRERAGVRAAVELGLGRAASMAELRAVPADRLTSVGALAHPGPGFGPVVDGVVLPAPPIRALQKSGLPAPVIIGLTGDEGSLMTNYRLTPEHTIAWLGGDDPAVLSAYGSLPCDPAAYARRLYRDVKFAAPARAVAGSARRGASAWLYRFDYLADALREVTPGVPHGGELNFLFDKLSDWPAISGSPTPKDSAMAARLSQAWASFAKHGDPATAAGCAAWKPYSRDLDNWFVFDDVSAMSCGEQRGQLDAIERQSYPPWRRTPAEVGI